MLKKLLFGALVVMGLLATTGEANAQYRCGGGGYYGGYRPYAAPYYGSRYYAAPAYGGYYNYGYRPYATPYYGYGRPAYAYPAPVYYGPRGGVTYVNPRVGVYVGF